MIHGRNYVAPASGMWNRKSFSEAVTVPLENMSTRMEKRDLWETIETIPAWSAAISYGEGKDG